MFEQLRQLRQLLRDNPRLWLIVVAAALMFVLIVWGVYGGFSLEIGRFFAAAPGPEVVINTAQPIKHGQAVSISWSANTATQCTASSWITTGGKNEGTATTDPVNACGTASSGTFSITCNYPDGASGTTTRTFQIDRSSCSAGPSPTATPTGGSGPTDASGACVFKTNFNAPEGAWFCKSLQCQLDGNPSGGQEYPPEGPASRLNINVYNRSVEAPNPALGPIFVRYILDATPKCANGKECYPPKDPLWTCSRPDGKEVDLGRDGHDYYDCYKPIFRVYDSVPVTCCANTGLPGDCFTVTETVPGGGASPTPAATPSLTPTPTPTASPTATSSPSPTSSAVPSPTAATLSCAPVAQTIPLGQLSEHSAEGGDGTYRWTAFPGAVQEEGAPGYATFSWLTAGTKSVMVTSAGQTATCTVVVTSGAAGGPFTVTKSARNLNSGSSTDIRSGEVVAFDITISAPLGGGGGIFRLTDAMPPGTSFVSGSARRDLSRLDDPARSGSQVTFDGISVSGGSSALVRYEIVADRTDTVRGQQTDEYRAEVIETRSGATNRDAAVTMTVFGTGAVGGDVTQIPTGPGDAVMFAVLCAAAASLLYSAYTRSAGFRVREAEKLGRSQEPMDFRS